MSIADLAAAGDGTNVPINIPLLNEQDYVNYKG
jgi:hypothetical protein